MTSPVVFLVSLLFVTSQCDFITKKNCRDVDMSKCDVHSVSVDTCPKGAINCPLKTNKLYETRVQFTPHFSSTYLKYSVSGDVHDTGDFNTVFVNADDACPKLGCPVVSGATQQGSLPIIMHKTSSPRFPVQVKIFNKYNESEACCFTFNVKVKK